MNKLKATIATIALFATINASACIGYTSEMMKFEYGAPVSKNDNLVKYKIPNVKTLFMVEYREGIVNTVFLQFKPHTKIQDKQANWIREDFFSKHKIKNAGEGGWLLTKGLEVFYMHYIADKGAVIIVKVINKDGTKNKR